MDGLFGDLRYAARQMRRNPGFAATAIVTLALGIGANAAMFTVLRGVLFAPLPYERPERIVWVRGPQGAEAPDNFSAPNLRDLQAQSKSFDDLAFDNYASTRSIDGSRGRERISLHEGGWNLLRVLGRQPILGRTFRADEEREGGSDVVVLSYDVWRTAFDGDRGIIGRQIKIWDKPYTVVGVMPSGFRFPIESEMEVWTPSVLDPKAREDRSSSYLDVIGRLKPGVSLEQAQAELSGIQAQIAKAHADAPAANHVVLTRYRDSLTKDVRKALLALSGAVVLVWLVACVNVANLMLTRAVGRRHEIAIRGALGATRYALVRQFLAETLLLSAVGSAAGLGLAVATIKLLWRSIDRALPLTQNIRVNTPVLLILIALSLLSAMLIGLLPALKAASASVQDGLRDSTAKSSASLRQGWLRDGLVVAQISLTLVLLASAGLLFRTLSALHQVPLGFRQKNVVTGSLNFPHGVYDHRNIEIALFEPLLEKLRALPGVKSAALSSVVPMRGEFTVTLSTPIKGRPELSFEQQPHADLRIASPETAETLGIEVLRGRFFTDEDTPDTPEVVVINQAFAKKYFPNEDPVGRSLGGKKNEWKIVGVIDDVKQTKLDLPTRPEVYSCSRQLKLDGAFYGIATAFTQLAVRTELPPETMIEPIRNAIRAVAPNAEMNEVKTMHEVIEDSIGSQTLAARLIGGFAGVALLIAVVGLYGLLAYTVGQRTREIGVRIALGATKENVLRLILRHALILLAVGVALGIGGAMAAGRVLKSFLFGVGAYDGFTIALVSAVLVACGLVAAYVPARRAAEIDPMTALRTE
jgi:predicted permease